MERLVWWAGAVVGSILPYRNCCFHRSILLLVSQSKSCPHFDRISGSDVLFLICLVDR